MLDIITGLGLYELGCLIWNAFMDLTVSFLLKSPEQLNSDAWSLFVDDLYPIFLAIGSAMILTFFMMGLYRDCTDYRQLISASGIAMILVRLVICNTCLLGVKSFISAAITAGQALSMKIMVYTGTFKNGEFGHLDATSTFFANRDTSLILASGFMGMIFLIAALICGAVICLTVWNRFFKLLYAIPTAALAMSTIAGGGGVSRSATSWLKEFLGNILEAPFIIIALALAVPLMNVSFFSGENFAASVLSIIEPAFKMVLITGAVKKTESVIRKYLAL